MTKEEAIIRYKTAMSVFKNWFAEGAITSDDLSAIDAVLAEKYGLSSCSIYFENDLLCQENRVIYGTAKGGRHGKKDY